ncbi:MAG: energy transducer TonB, partial [Alphaproteobacteria bacterium]|nr:energy transducer TonB [Alphaproteobacteria bacterium]
MRGAAVISALLHLVLVALAYFGLPELFNAREPVEVPITVEVVTIAEEATAPPQPVVETPPAPKPEPPPEPVAKEPESVAEPVAEPPPEPEPAPVPAPQEALEPAPAPEAAPPPEPA